MCYHGNKSCVCIIIGYITGAEDLCRHHQYLPPNTCRKQENDRTPGEGHAVWGEDSSHGGTE